MKACAKLFISSTAAEGVFGDGKWILLKAVKEHGSIQKASTALGRSYRKAWGDIKKAEETLGNPLVAKRRGGPEGGQTVLTPFCEKLLDAWHVHRRSILSCVNSSYEKNLAHLCGPQDGLKPDGIMSTL
jgi:molybdate transport system regulatory protein